ncbi:MAG: ABC transporter permease, partial [Candidatus Villigracilaceae bacterium]
MMGRSPGMMGHGGPMAMMKGETARNFKGTMIKLIAYLGAYKLLTAIVILLAIASTVFSIFGPKILGNATTKLFEGVMGQIAGTGAGIDFAAIGWILFTALGLYVLSAILAYAQGWIMTGIAVDITYRFRRDIAEKINHMPLGYFDGTNHGEVLSRITNDVDTVNQTLSQSLSQIITSVVTVVGILAMMLSISWQMTMVALLIIPLTLIIVRFIVSRSQRY